MPSYVDMTLRVHFHDVGGDTWNAIPVVCREIAKEEMDFVVERFGGRWRFGTAVGQQMLYCFVWDTEGLLGKHLMWSLDFSEDWLEGPITKIENKVLGRMFDMLASAAEAELLQLREIRT